MTTYRIQHDKYGTITDIQVGTPARVVFGYVSGKRVKSYRDKVRAGENFLVRVGHTALVWIGNKGTVTNIKVFNHPHERENFLNKLPQGNGNTPKVTLHTVERLADRFEYARKYSIEGLFNTVIRLVSQSRVSFRTSGGKEFRRCGRHMFVVCDDIVVTMFPARPEFLIYEEAFTRSGVPIPDVLVSKHIAAKSSVILSRASF